MGVVIMATGVKAQLDTATSTNTSIGEWCRGRIDAINAFEGDDELRGAGWDSARERFSQYSSFFQCLAYGAEQVSAGNRELSGLIDEHLGEVFAQGYGSGGRVVEDTIVAKRDEARRKARYFKDKLDHDGSCKLPVIGGIFKSSYSSKHQEWLDRLRKAEAALQHVADYKGSTADIYAGRLDAINRALLAGAKSFSGAPYDARSGTWGSLDESWIVDMSNACDSGITSSADLRDADGMLDSDALQTQFQKPLVLWTAGETRAVAQAYQEAGKSAVDGDTTDLETFLNSGYEQVPQRERELDGDEPWRTAKGERTNDPSGKRHVDKPENSNTHYRMTQGFEGFLALYYLGSQSKAARQEDALSDDEYLLNGITCGLLMFGGDIVAGAKEGEPGIRVSVGNEGTVEGTRTTFTYDQVSYGSKGETFEVFRDGDAWAETSKLEANKNDYENYYSQKDIHRAQAKVDNYVLDYVGQKLLGKARGSVSGAISTGVKALGPEAEMVYKGLKEVYDFAQGYSQAQADLEAQIQSAQTEVKIQDAARYSRSGVIVSNGTRSTVTATSKNPYACLTP